MRPRTALALGLAGLATAGLGAILPAGAEVRTFELTLNDGSVVMVSVDVPADADPWTIEYPGVQATDIVAIAETETPPTVSAPGVAQDAGAIAGQVPPAPQTAPAPAQPGQPVPPAEQPKAGEPTPEDAAPQGEPQVGEGGGKQKSTGKKKRRDPEAEDAEQDTAPRPEERRSEVPGEAGLPTVNDPTMSLATPGAAPIGVPNFFIDKFRIPPFLLSLYQAAGVEYGVRWEILAAINEIETDYGRNLNVSSAGALGWMQFMPSTWKQYGVDANGDKRKDPYNPVDAIFAAARYLRAAGAETDLRKAIFAYNHADWYVDSVLMRARLIGGLPSNLVGSLTGLTQGVFPVAARARYADDLDEREARRRVGKARNAAVPVESSPTRRGIKIYAKPGSPVVAVQDGKIVKVGNHERLGRFVMLRDAYGNTYTYAHLGWISKRHPVPKEPDAPAPVVKEPPKDPAPTQAASAGTQKQRAAKKRVSTTRRVRANQWPESKERVWANPKRPQAWRAGAKEQVLSVARGSDLDLLDLPADEVVMKELKVGSKVVGGTVLGKVARYDNLSAPHVLFEIRPAGRGAPRIDPKPILDGWKLLESTELYRAEGRNPFFGRDAKAPSIGQILLMRKSELEQRVLRNPRVEVYGCGRRDVRASDIDRRVLATLEFLAASGLRPSVTSLKCGHSVFTASGNVSHHSSGNAVDIAKINGIPILGHQGRGSVTDITVRRLLTLQGLMKPAQIITLMKYEGQANTYAMGDHHDHIHIGWQPMYGTNSKLGRQLNAVLKPGQWIKLIDRLGDIDNPTVSVKPSKAALVVKPSRASARHHGE